MQKQSNVADGVGDGMFTPTKAGRYCTGCCRAVKSKRMQQVRGVAVSSTIGGVG